jgi:transcription antitermination factor NusG
MFAGSNPPLPAAVPAVIAHTVQPDAQWFAVYTSSRHEKWVTTNLMQRQIESFLPLYEKVHHWSKRTPVRLKLPLFPNYVFVHTPPQGRISVLAVPGVIAIVGRGNVPSPLPDHEIEMLRSSLEQGRFEPHPYLGAGERVRIRSGALEGIEGIVVRRKNEVRVVLTLELIQRSVAIEVDTDCLEPVLRHRRPAC